MTATAGRRAGAEVRPVEEESRTPLFAADAAESFRSRWQDIQTSFVDEPTGAVEQADSLVAEIMQQLAKTFADERAHLEAEGEHGEDISTEDLGKLRDDVRRVGREPEGPDHDARANDVKPRIGELDARTSG